MSSSPLRGFEDERARERIRQEREIFDQRKKQAERWFNLRLRMGYASILLLTCVLILCSWILIDNNEFPPSVVTAAAGALFADVLGLLTGIWKIVLNPTLVTELQPAEHTLPPRRDRSG